MTDEPEKSGYRHPPKATRFGQPGGNPRGRGRAKGSRNVSTIAAEALAKKVTVKENGVPRRLSKLEAAMAQLSNQAAQGDLRAIGMILALATGLEARGEAQKAPVLEMTEADQRVVELLAKRVRDQVDRGR